MAARGTESNIYIDFFLAHNILFSVTLAVLYVMACNEHMFFLWFFIKKF